MDSRHVHELLNSLRSDQLIPLGTTTFCLPRINGPGIPAPDGWAWLPPPVEDEVPVPDGHDILAAVKRLVEMNLARATFKVSSHHDRATATSALAYVRVYVIPNDIQISGERPKLAQKLLKKLILELDTSTESWNAEPKIKRCKSESEETREETSLFYLFNTLPSPDPKPERISEDHGHVKELIEQLLPQNNDQPTQIDGLKSELYKYQRRSIATMIQRELAPRRSLDPRLKKISSPRSQRKNYYVDLTMGQVFRSPRYYDNVKGGILAEEMGLGKTLICLALILATKYQQYSLFELETGSTFIDPNFDTVPSLMDMVARQITSHGLAWRYEIENGDISENAGAALKKNWPTYEADDETPRSRRVQMKQPKRKIWVGNGTIVVCPPNLIQQWQAEIEKHVEPGALKVLTLVTSAKEAESQIPDVQELLQYDVVLFSKSRFDKEEREGKDNKNRKQWYGVPKICECPYIGATRVPFCTCLKPEEVYHSPIFRIHWKRLIVDEGHNMSGKTRSIIVATKLRCEARWVVSGTPSSGLVGVNIGLASTSETTGIAPGVASQNLKSTTTTTTSSEAEDIKHLGQLVRDFLRLKPWSEVTSSNSTGTLWNTYVSKDFLQRKPGATECVRNIMNNVFIRHLVEDVEEDVKLTKLTHETVFIEPGFFEKLNTNLFVMSLATNAVTSERVDEDYIFHPKNRIFLNQLITNLLRESGFFWTGFSPLNVIDTVHIAESYLKNPEKLRKCSERDIDLLKQSVKYGEMALRNPLWKVFATYHEMGYFVSGFSIDLIAAWALNADIERLGRASSEPHLLGGTQLSEIKDVVQETTTGYPEDSLVGQGIITMRAYQATMDTSTRKTTKPPASGVTGSTEGTLLSAASSTSERVEKAVTKAAITTTPKPSPKKPTPKSSPSRKRKTPTSTPVPSTPVPSTPVPAYPPGTLAPASSLHNARLLGTSSRKLSHLLTLLLAHTPTEKFLIFYESETIAHYILELLQILSIPHLLYRKSLPAALKASYLHTFNAVPTHRVLLMDLGQASHGLNITAASRVVFMSPVWQRDREAQALKRAHRIGQTREVRAYTFVMKGGVEEEVLKRRAGLGREEGKGGVGDDGVLRAWIEETRFLGLEEGEWRETAVAAVGSGVKLFGREENGASGEIDGSVGVEGVKGLVGNGAGERDAKKRKIVIVLDSDDE